MSANTSKVVSMAGRARSDRGDKRIRKATIADIQAERATLGGVLISPEWIDQVAAILEPSDFYDPQHNAIWQAILDLHAAGKAVDIVGLDSQLSHDHLLGEVPQSVTSSLLNAVPTSRRTMEYARTVLDLALERRAQAIGAEMTTYELTPSEVITRLQALEERRMASRGDDIFSLEDLMAEELPEVRWIVPGFLPEGLSILGAKQKIGKSWLAYALAIAVAEGGQVLQRRVEPGAALYLALEDGKRRLQERARKLLGNKPVPKGLTLANKWPGLNAGGADQIEAWLRKNTRARLVIIDVFAKVKPPRAKGADPYAEDYAAMTQLKTLADKYHVAVLVIHHTRKAEATDVFDELTGSVGIAGACDTVMVLTRARGEADAVLHVTGREIEKEGAHALRFDQDKCEWQRIGDAAKYEMNPERRNITIILKQFGEASPKQVAARLGKNESTTRTLMSKMADEGQIKATGRGTYCSIYNSVDSVDAHTHQPRNSLASHESTDAYLPVDAKSTESTLSTKTTKSIESTHSLTEMREGIRSWAWSHGWPEFGIAAGRVIEEGEGIWRIFLKSATEQDVRAVFARIQGEISA